MLPRRFASGLEPSWKRLGASGTASWSCQERSWSAFGTSQRPQETSKSTPRAPRRFQDASRFLRDHQEVSKRHSRCFQDAPKMIFGLLWSSKNGDFDAYICQKSNFLTICFQDASKTLPRRLQGAPRRPKTVERHVKDVPRRLKPPQDFSKMAQAAPKTPHRCSQDAPRTSKTPPKRLKTSPKTPQDAPKTLPRRPNTPGRRPNTLPRGTKTPTRGLQHSCPRIQREKQHAISLLAKSHSLHIRKSHQ